jgi:dihydrofolate reductase
MRLVATEYVTLDGVFEEPGQWSHPFFDDEAGQFKWAELEAADAQLLGRKTYEGFAAAWPTMEGTGDFGVKMNTMPKYVVSSTLTNPTWSGTTVLSGDFMSTIRELKQRPGQDLLLAGSGQLFNGLMKENLIDVYRLMVHPIVLGKGPRLFADGEGRHTLDLVDVKRFSKGIVVLELVPANTDPR